MPYDGAEGGYQYVDGGPYDAREVLEDAFEFVPPPVLDEAVAEFEQEATEWVESDRY